MIKTLVTAGCSFTIDHYQLTWADYLAQELNCKLINVAARGAGLNFISKRLILSLQGASTDSTLVGIMLPSSDRFDYYVDHEHVLKEDFVGISSWQGGGKSSLVNLDGTLSDNSGYSLTGGQPRGHKAHWYKFFYNKTESYINYWFYVLLIQDYLKLRGFKYFFLSAYAIDNNIEQSVNQSTNLIECDNLTNLIDFNSFIFHQDQLGFLDYVQSNEFEIKNHHPVTEAHNNFVKKVVIPGLLKCY
jgi:hypothetical protein